MCVSLTPDVWSNERAFVDNVVSGSLEAQRSLKDRVMALARKHLTAEEYMELEHDFAAGNVEVRLYPDGAVLTRGA
jgi:hypothetical protein